MKKLDKIILTIFSIIILVGGIVACLVIAEILDVSTAQDLMRQALTTEPANKVMLTISIISILLAVKALLWGAPTVTEEEIIKGKDVLLKNDNGRLMISVATIESLVNSVVSGFNSVQEIKTGISVDEENNVSVLVNLIVTKDVVIKDLTVNIQNKIKEAIKKTSDLDVKEVNVRIKNVVSVPEVENKD